MSVTTSNRTGQNTSRQYEELAPGIKVGHVFVPRRKRETSPFSPGTQCKELKFTHKRDRCECVNEVAGLGEDEMAMN